MITDRHRLFFLLEHKNSSVDLEYFCYYLNYLFYTLLFICFSFVLFLVFCLFLARDDQEKDTFFSFFFVLRLLLLPRLLVFYCSYH